jgi:hypothetical protein
VLGKQLWDTKMNVYPQILPPPPPPRPYYPAPAAARLHPHQYQHPHYPAPAAARFFDPYQHPGVATAAAAGPYPDQNRSVTSLARQPKPNASASEIVVSRYNLATQSLVTLKRALVSIQSQSRRSRSSRTSRVLLSICERTSSEYATKRS